MNPSHRPAFTLIEAIIAMVILSVAVPAMLLAIRTVHDKRAAPILSSRARWLAAEKLEDVIADRNSSTRGFGYLISANYLSEPTIAGFPGFSRSVWLSQTGADLQTPGTGYMNITVTVTWNEGPGGGGAGTARSLALGTVLTSFTP